MLFIVPDLPPNINGVGDYALILARQMRKNGVTGIAFLVAGKADYQGRNIDDFPVHQLSLQTPAALYDLLKKTVNDGKVYLQYVGYGYSQRGIPYWLVRGLKQWMQERTNHLYIFFHELYAKSARPWTSSFWLSLIQQSICNQLCRLADVVITNRAAYAEYLQKSARKEVTVMPVFSNVGEPDKSSSLRERKKQLVIFGSAGNRKFIYERYSNEINEICSFLSIDKVVDIGEHVSEITGISKTVVLAGQLDPPEISALLADSQVAFMGWPSSEWFAKSGVFAAYAAHAMLVLTPAENKTKTIVDGLTADRHYLDTDALKSGFSETHLQQIAANAFLWYKTHSSIVTAQKQVRLFYDDIK